MLFRSSDSLQLLAAEQSVVRIPQLQSLLTDEVIDNRRPAVRVSQTANDELEIERAAVMAAAAQQAQAEPAAEAQFFGAETAVDQSIQDIVEALLSGDLS